MTEEEWVSHSGSSDMLNFLGTAASDGKLQLFSAACCRRIWHLLEGQAIRKVVEDLESHADKSLSDARMTATYGAAEACFDSSDAHVAVWHAASYATGQYPIRESVFLCAYFACVAAARHADPICRSEPWLEHWQVVGLPFFDAERIIQYKVLRHMFRCSPVPECGPGEYPRSVAELANAVYNGENSTFALHDALLEAGHPDFAEHFHQEQWHPKGCWLLDTILGKN